jgi:peptidoglycan hydrolase-like protein with peptidoglycan-binding domain
MMRPLAALIALLIVLPSFSFASTCIERNEECSLGELMEINTNAQKIGLAQHEHIAVLLEIISNLRRIITTFQATKEISHCVDLKHDLRPGTTDAKTDGGVSTLQFFLTSQRVYDGLVTGYYGPSTAHSVYMWQKQNNIEGVTPQTGVGPLTRAKIRSATCAVLE